MGRTPAMTQQKDARSGQKAIQARPGEITRGLSGIELTAAALSVVWLVISAAFFLFSGDDGTDGLRFLLTLMVIFFPVGMIWVAAVGARSSRIMLKKARGCKPQSTRSVRLILPRTRRVGAIRPRTHLS